MDRSRFERYLGTFPSCASPGDTVFSRAVLRALDAVYLPAGRSGIRESRVESSVGSAAPGAVRFIHYYRPARGQSPAARRKVWVAGSGRFLRLLEELNGAGAAFAVAKAARIRAALAGFLPKHSAVIVSAEWLPPARQCLKATVYFVTEEPLGKAAAELESITGCGAWLGQASAENMGFLGADFYPGGAVEFKIYRRCPPAAPLAGRPGRLAEKLRGAAGLYSVYKTYKYNGAAGRVFLDKVHLLVRGARPEPLAAGEGAAGRKTMRLFERHGGGRRIICVGAKPAGAGFELYFR